MKEELKIDIPYLGFPNQFVTDKEKATIDFGLQIGTAIQYEWFRKDGTSCRYYDRWNEFNRRRLYARAEQPIGKYKNELAVDGDLSYLNLDWTPIAIIPKFVDIVVNGMSDRLFEVKVYAQDALSLRDKERFKDVIQGQMVAKPILEQIQKDFGIKTFINNPDELPKDDSELNLYMELNYKPEIEIAEEVAISTIFAENHFDDLRKRVDYDITVLGIGIAKHQFLKGNGIQIDYVDPAYVVHSYTEDPYFKDVFYWGEVKTQPITDIVKIKPDITDEELEEISQYSQSWYDTYNVPYVNDNDIFSRDTCTLLYFSYKTTKSFVYKKKISEGGGSKVIEKDDDFNPPDDMMESNNFKKISKKIDVWYEGVMVMGTNIVLKWEMAKNMVRPKSATQNVMCNYAAVAPRMYKGRIESLVERMIPFADLIQMTHLKLQQVISRIVPDGVFIDADGLNEVDLGTGAAYNPEDALRLYFQTGSVIGRSYTQDGDFNNARIPIQELNSSSGNAKMMSLINAYNHYLNLIRTSTGLNEARDGSMPDPDSLVGLQKLAALNSNTATRHILQGSLFITRTIAEGLSSRISDVLEYSEFKDEFAMQIGKDNMSVIEKIKDLYLFDFGIFIEIAPDEEEKRMLEQNIQIALQRGDINLEDAIDIREIKNIKLANQLLKVKRKQKVEKDQQYEMQKQQAQQQGQIQSQQVAAQTAMQKIQMETQSKIQIKQAEIQLEAKKMEQEANLKLSLMQEEFNLNMQLRNIDVRSKNDREMFKEKAKDKRIDRQNTQQSKLISQRKFDLPSISFESNEDSLDGFDLSEFEPR